MAQKEVHTLNKKIREAYALIDPIIKETSNSLYASEINGLSSISATYNKKLKDFRFLVEYLSHIRLYYYNSIEIYNSENYRLKSIREYFQCEYSYDIQNLIDIFNLNTQLVFVPPTQHSFITTKENVLWGFSLDLLTELNIYEKLVIYETERKNISRVYNGDNGYIYFAIPSNWGVISSILDPNNFEFIDDFNRQLWNIVLPNNDTAMYYVYSLGRATYQGDNYIFKF